MSWSARIVVALAFSLAAGLALAKPPAMPSPVMDENVVYELRGFTPAEAAPDHMTRPISNDNGIIYEQNFGGGGVATGVLFGPFGVAANVTAIKHRTEKEAAELNGKIAIDPQQLFKKAAADLGLTLALEPTDKAVILKPSLSVASIDGEQLGFDVTLVVDARPTGKKWIGRYVYELHPRFARSAIVAGLPTQDVDTLEEEAAAAMTEVLHLYMADGRGELIGTQRVKFKSPFISRRFSFQLQGEEIATEQTDRFLVRLPLAVYSLPRDDVSIEK